MTVAQLRKFLENFESDRVVRFVDHNNEEMKIDEMYECSLEPTITFFQVTS